MSPKTKKEIAEWYTLMGYSERAAERAADEEASWIYNGRPNKHLVQR